MPVRFGSILHLNNSASEATLDANNLRGTTVQIDKFDSASLATIGVGLTTAPGKRRLGTIVATTGSADAGVKYYAFIQTSSGDTLLSGSEWTTLTNWKQIQVDATTIDTSSFVLNSATSSFILESETGSFVLESETGSFVNNSATSSFVNNSATSSFVNNSATSSFVLNSATSSFVNNSATSSFVLNSATSSFVNNSATSSFVNNSATSSFVNNSATSSFVNNSATSSFVNNSATSSFVNNSATSSFVLNSATSSFILESQTGSFVLESETGSFLLNTTDTFEGVLTLSGNLSVTGDGNITASNGTFEGGIIRANTDSENYIKGALSFKGGATAYRAASIARGGASLGTVSGDVETADLVISTNNLNNFFIFKGNTTGGGALIISGGNSPASGSPSLDVRGPISASGNISSSGDIFANNIRAVGDVIAQRYIVSSSVSHITQSFSSGSTIFGDTSNDTHQFTGSLSITGSSVTSERTPLVITAGGEVQVADADFVVAGEFVANSATSSFVNNSATSSFVNNSATSSFVFNSSTGSFVLESETGSFITTASATNNVITFTEGDGGTFTITIDTGSATTITGTDKQVLFFDGDNNPAGDPGLTYNKSSDTLFISGNIEHAGDTNTGIFFGSDTITLKGNNAQIAKFDTSQIIFNENVNGEFNGLFLSGGLHDWGKNNDVDSTSGFRVASDRAYTHVTPQFTRARHALVGNIIRDPSVMNLAAFPLNYLVYGKAGVTINGGSNDTDPDVDTPVDPKIAGGKDNVGIPVVQIAGDLEIRPTQSMDGGGTTPGIRIAAGDSSGSVDPGIFFYNRDNISNDSSSFFYSSASAEIRFDTASQSVKFFAGSTTEDLKEVLHISKSGDNPRIGIGTNNPIRAFDFKEIRDDNRGGEILIRGSRSTKGAENNDEVGRINFAIDSSSFGKIDTSGSAAEIVAIVDDIDPTGVEGSLSLRVAGAKTAGSVQRIKLIGNPNSPAVEITGSTEFDTDVTIGDDLTVSDFALLNSARIGSTATDPGDGVLHVEDYGVFVGGLKIGSSEDPGANNLIVDGTATLKGITNIGNATGDTLVVSASNVDFPSVANKSNASATDNILILDGDRVKKTPQSGLPYISIQDGVVPGGSSNQLLMFTGSGGTKKVKIAPGVTHNATNGYVFSGAGTNFDILALKGFITSTTVGSLTASANISASGTVQATTLDASTFGSTLSSNISGAFTSTSASLASKTLFTTITTSGNISASGNLIGNEITASGNVDIGGILSIPGFSSVSASLASAVAGGDNLGNHTATQDLDLDGNSIKDALHITASGNISASGDIAGNTITVAGTDFINLHSTGYRVNSGAGPLNLFGNITASGDISSSGTIVGSNLSGTNTGDQDLSGFLSSSAQIASNISGAFTSTSASLASNIATNIDHISDLTAATSSYVNNSATSSFVFNSSTGSFAIAADISGAFDADSSSLATRLATAESELGNTLLSSSAQISTDISGAFTSTSASLAADIVTNAGNIGTTTNALTVDNATLKLNSGTTFNGSAARTISIKDGGVDSDALAANIAVTQLTASAISASGTVTANSFTGNGLSIDGSSNSHIEVGTYNVGFDTLGANTLFITGSGLIVSGAMADANHHNMVKIGNVELIDLNTVVSPNEFLIHNVSSFKITSGSDGGEIAGSNQLFEHNGTDFKLYRNNSSVINAAANGAITFNGTNISFVASSATFMKATNTTPGANGHLIFTEGDPNTTPSELRSINWDSAFPFLGGAVTASAVSASGTIVGSNLSGTNTGDQDLSGFLSSSAQIASNISGAFTSTSSSLAADIATNAGNIGTTTNALTVDNATLQLNSGTTFNGSAARTISIKDGGVDSDALADDITVAGTLTVAADIQHSGDTDTKIAFSTDVVSIKAGNTSVFTSSPTGSVLPNVHQNIFDTGSLALNANSAFGDIVKMGDTNTTAGGVYYLKNDGTWALAQANAAATSTGSLAVAVGTNSTTDGMCLRGLMNPFTDPGAGIGSPVYISDTHPGRILATAPSSTGDVVRIVGHQFGTDLIYFNPSNDFIVHA